MIKVCIEVEAGSCERHQYNERTLAYEGMRRRVSRPYPYPYGFIPGTNAADGESVDCYIITSSALKPGTVVECEPIGLLEQNEGGQTDHKVLAALPEQKVEVGQRLFQELRDFIYAAFAEFPSVEVCVGPILPREAALDHIQGCRAT